MNDDTRPPDPEREIAAAWREATARDAAEAPPPARDAGISAAARAAVAEPRRRSWLVPLALAASVMLAVGIGLRQQAGVTPPAEEQQSADSASAPANEVAVEAPAVRTRAAQGVPETAVAKEAPRAQAPAKSGLERESSAIRGEPAREASPAAAAADARAAPLGQDPVARIRGLIEAGRREEAIALAREHLARFGPDALPAELRRHLHLTPP